MGRRRSYLMDRLLHRTTVRRWASVAEAAPAMELDDLRTLRGRARQIRRHLDRVMHDAEARLRLPLIGSNAMTVPAHADWTWRPELWRGPVTPHGVAGAPPKTRIGSEATLFHDCTTSELSLRQVRNSREEDLAPFGLRMDVFRFDGSFLSLVIDLPADAIRGLTRRHMIRLGTLIEFEKPLEIFARLNIRHGPNTEQIVREIDPRFRSVTTDFDLGYSRLNERRIEAAWLELIFERPEFNQVTLRDVTACRLPRSEI